MFEIRNAVGNQDSSFGGKEALGTDDVVLGHGCQTVLCTSSTEK